MTSTILVIDDSREFQRLMELRLKSFVPDLSFTACSTLAEARRRLDAADAPPDLIILDHHLPDGKGTELLEDERLAGLAVLAVSSDDAPELPGGSVRAGAAYFLMKARVSEPLFKPLVLGLLDRNRIRRELEELKRKATEMNAIHTLIDTLRHEINNPLGAVLGAAYILRMNEAASPDQREAARLVEESGKRIKHVMDELSRAMSLDAVTKADHVVFQIPGDEPWEK